MRASTKEKRALSMKLTVKLAYCLPADYFPLVFSDGFLKSVTSCRAKDHNLLFEYAGGILNEILAVVGKRIINNTYFQFFFYICTQEMIKKNLLLCCIFFLNSMQTTSIKLQIHSL